MLVHHDFLDDRKFCPSCDEYVSYLSSLTQSYCMRCGHPVRLFSERDYSRFRQQLRAERSLWREGPEPA